MGLQGKNVRPRRAALAAVAAALAAASPLAAAVRASGPPPSASAVQSAPQQPAPQQSDETASLRSGLVTATSERGDRLQVQGVWLAVVDGTTQVLRGGKASTARSLKVGETVRFTAAPAGEGQAPVLRVIYAQ